MKGLHPEEIFDTLVLSKCLLKERKDSPDSKY